MRFLGPLPGDLCARYCQSSWGVRQRDSWQGSERAPQGSPALHSPACEEDVRRQFFMGPSCFWVS